MRTVPHEPPPLAWIQEIEIVELEALGEEAFSIRGSVAETGEFALVSPDVATCADCFGDFTRPANRRFGYAFTNCTNCGPRYTIIRDIPYDRPNTTMAAFPMCAACQRGIRGPRRPALSRAAQRVSRVRAAGLGLLRFNRLRPLPDGRGSESASEPRP